MVCELLKFVDVYLIQMCYEEKKCYSCVYASIYIAM